jgi:hypothetical protein
MGLAHHHHATLEPGMASGGVCAARADGTKSMKFVF